MKKGFREMLAARQQKVQSLLCVGLDPLPEEIPDCISRGEVWSKVVIQMREIIDATAGLACMFKPQKAHYEAIPEGQRALQAIVDYIHYMYPDIPVFLDCKRGDISRTQERYKIAQFEIDGVDGMNFNPYMGKECMEFLVDNKRFPGRAVVGLCYTSNKSARQTQDILLADGRAYWEFIAQSTLEWAEDLEATENAGLVMAAAYEPKKGSGEVYSKHLSRGREIVGDMMWYLIPGVGTQGGFAEETVRAAWAGWGSMAVNSSSSITFASRDDSFPLAAEREAKKLRDQMLRELVAMDVIK